MTTQMAAWTAEQVFYKFVDALQNLHNHLVVDAGLVFDVSHRNIGIVVTHRRLDVTFNHDTAERIGVETVRPESKVLDAVEAAVAANQPKFVEELAGENGLAVLTTLASWATRVHLIPFEQWRSYAPVWRHDWGERSSAAIGDEIDIVYANDILIGTCRRYFRKCGL